MKTKTLLFIVSTLLFAADIFAQLPDTDIYLFKELNGKKHYYGSPVNITNRKGYDNQPCFSPDGKEILFVSITDTLQSDIWSYDIEKKKTKQLTYSKESEYSPTFIRDGKTISTVRVDTDSGQRLYTMPYPSLDKSELIKNTDSIGYSCMVNENQLIMFLVGDTNTLQSLDLKTGKRTFIANEPGRCIKVNPKNKMVYYIDKSDSLNWLLMKFDPTTLIPKKVSITFPGAEDFAFFSNGIGVCAKNGTLYKLNESKGAWLAVGDKILPTDLDYFRIAISADDKYIAVVVKNEKQKK